jgi:hypothetical protein
MCNSFLVVHVTTIMWLFKKSKIVYYMRKYIAYKLPFTKHIWNYSATIEQLAYFFDMKIYLLNHHIYNV